jgi:hypothetical protein
MTPIPTIHPDNRPPAKPTIPEPPNDGFPPDEDVSIPPADSDVKTGAHKAQDK